MKTAKGWVAAVIMVGSLMLGGMAGWAETWWSLQHTNWPPLPWNPFPDAEVYSLGSNNWVYNDLAVDYVGLETEAQARSALNRLDMFSTLDVPTDPGEGAGGGSIDVPPAYNYSTNELWLEISSSTNPSTNLSVSSFVIHSPETNGVYDLFMTTNLSPDVAGLNLTNWTWLLRCAPGQTNLVVTNPPLSEAYFRLAKTNDLDADGLTDAFEMLVSHSYVTNADTDGDGLPDGWEWNNFGNFDQTATNDYDGDFVDNGTEYTNSTNPNKITFDSHFAQLYVNNRTVTGNCDAHTGQPAFLAVLVDSTNLESAAWSSYTASNFSATLPDSDGPHTVLVALRGYNPGYPPEVDETEFTLDRVPPVLVITNPIVTRGAATVTKPYLQLQGYGYEPLASLSYDLTNALGLVTNELALVTAQVFNTNIVDFTTNYLQGYDIPLANGLNTITLRVSDRAGNVTVTNFDVTLDYSSANPPVMQLIWPTNGMYLSGDSFYVRGSINDETAQVRALLVDTNGGTNEVAGIVERNGMFWVENLPLTAGTNALTLVAVDAAGNLSSTNLSVVKSSVTLAIDSTPTGDDLYKPTGAVSGTVSETSYNVTVNGISASVESDGHWTAANVPVLGRGTATFDAVAADGGSAAPPANVSTTREFEARLAVSTYHLHTYWNINDGGPWPSGGEWTKNLTASLVRGNNGWQKLEQGTADDRSWDDDDGHNTNSTPVVWETHSTDHYVWNGTNELTLSQWYHNGQLAGTGGTNAVAEWVKTAPQDWSWGPEYYAEDGSCHWFKLYAPGEDEEWEVDACTDLTLYTGGKAQVGRKNLFCIRCSGNEYLGRPWSPYSRTIPPEQLEAFGQKVGADGKLWLVLPDNEVPMVHLYAPGKKHYYADARPTKHKLRIRANGKILNPDYLLLTSVPTFIVGEYVTVSSDWDQTPPGIRADTNWWTLGGTYMNDQTNTVVGGSMDNSSDVYFANPDFPTNEWFTSWWVTGGVESPETYLATLSKGVIFTNGQAITLTEEGPFNMWRPKGKISANTGTVAVDTNFYSVHSGIADQLLGLHYGVIRPFGTPGILSFSTNSLPGEFQWVQKINSFEIRYRTNSGGVTLRASGSNGLDTVYPYPKQADDAHEDSPGVSIDPEQFGTVWLSRADNFDTWLQFKPSGGHWVPLRRIHWEWSGEAVLSNGVWVLVNPRDVHNPQDVEEYKYPVWTHIIDISRLQPSDYHVE